MPAESTGADSPKPRWDETMPSEQSGTAKDFELDRTAPIQETAATQPGSRAVDSATARNEAQQVTRPLDATGVAGTAHEGSPSAATGVDVERTLGGYRLRRELGRGAMGAVYLARQLSLDRDVALKTIQDELAQDPRFIARFTREAYAAAQLTHHNVVQIYDLGAEAKTHFFSMEFVDGESLADLVGCQGLLEPELAVSYTLQAARGLHYAHQLGMVHRDVKPGNLLLNRLGVVKVADLGLVKTRSSVDSEGASSDVQDLHAVRSTRTTLVNVAMGTPAYMAPEQASNAADVDHRADIYSLGCTLYVLLTGRPPFDGRTAAEVITKHKTEPVVRPDVIVSQVPGQLSEIVMKMVAKDPDERYSDLADVIHDLEAFLGVGSSVAGSQREEDVAQLERWALQYDQAPLAKYRGLLLPGFSGICLAAGLLGLLLGAWSLAFGAAGAAVLTPTFYVLLSGWRQRDFLIGKLRELLFGSRWTDFLMAGATILLLVLVVFVLQLGGAALVAVVISLLAAGGLAYAVDVQMDKQRRESLDHINDLLKRLRIRGEEEAALRQIVARYSGEQWEELFEALFGYEAKLEARQAWGRSPDGKLRKRHAVWRDVLIRWIDASLAARREAKQRRHLLTVEQAGLQATGVSAEEARRQATANADALVSQAAQLHATLAAVALEQNPQVAAARKRERMKAMLQEARGGAAAPERTDGASVGIARWLLLPFSGRVRFFVGVLLVAACVLWVRQNETPVDGIGSLARLVWTGSSSLNNLQLPLVPPALSAVLSGVNVGAAGLTLLLSALLFRGYRICLFVIPAALIMLLGHRMGIPDLMGLSAELVSLGIGGGLCILGVLFGRSPA